jgi:hypothetical protein
VDTTTVIDAAIGGGLKVGSCGEYLDRRRLKMEKQLFDIMQQYCLSARGRQRRIDEYNQRKKASKPQEEWRNMPNHNNQGPSS